MKALLLLGLAGGIALSGCFTMALDNKFYDNRHRIGDGPDTLLARLPDNAIHVVCTPVQRRLYKLEGAGTQTWLRFPQNTYETAILQDLVDYVPKFSSRQAPGKQDLPLPPLDLVVATSAFGFVPKDSAGSPLRAMLLMRPPPSPGEAQSIPLGNRSATLIYSVDGAVRWAAVEIHTPRFKPAQQRASNWRWGPLYLVTVPLDILTSPLQLMILLFSGGWLSGLGTALM